MENQRPSEDVWRQALDHVLAERSSNPEPGAAEASARWRVQRPEHDAAYREAESVWQVAGNIPPVHSEKWAPDPRQHRLTRRHMLMGGAGALAAGLAGVAVLPTVLQRFGGGVRTGAGELRRLSLPDGSRVVLGPETHLELDFDAERRVLRLRTGDAYFDVVSDPKRPFVVRSGSMRVRVVGTAFELRQRDARFSVAVSHGRVDVSGAIMTSGDVSLGAGDWLTVDGSGLVEHGRGVADRIASWRDRMIVVDRRPVADVVDEIAPWYRGRILLLDGALGARPVSGVFDLDNPVAALEAVVGPFGGKVRTVSPWLAVITG